MLRIFIAMLLLGISHSVCFYVMTELKYPIRTTVFIYAGYTALFVGLSMLSAAFFRESNNALGIGFAATITVALLIFMLTSADPVCKKLFLFLSYANVFCICACFSLLLCKVFFNDASESFVYYARNITRTVLFVLMVFSYIRFLRSYVKIVSGQQRKIWYSISTVSFLFLFIFTLCLLMLYTKENVRAYISLFTVAVLVYVATLWIIFGIIKFMIAENNAALVYQNMAYLREQLKSAKENELSSRAVRHDFRHHNRNLEAMLKRGEVQEALAYLKQYNDSLDEIMSNDFCPNITVNAILNSFYTKAKNRGISITIEADIAEASAVSDMDFNAVLSNLLENAVNGCMECQTNGSIKLNIRTVGDKIVIVCSNSCKKDIAVENGMLKNSGVGISSMLLAIRKYDGDIEYRYDNETLNVCIILNS